MNSLLTISKFFPQSDNFLLHLPIVDLVFILHLVGLFDLSGQFFDL
jgi:hypothetical protein